MATLKSDAQTTAAEVKEIFDTSLPDATINAYINAAVAKRKEIPDFDGFDSTRAAEIEKFLAAHLLTAQDPRTDEEQHESTTLSFEGEHTTYLDIAASLDPTGTLAGENDSVSFDVPRVK